MSERWGGSGKKSFATIVSGLSVLKFFSFLMVINYFRSITTASTKWVNLEWRSWATVFEVTLPYFVLFPLIQGQVWSIVNHLNFHIFMMEVEIMFPVWWKFLCNIYEGCSFSESIQTGFVFIFSSVLGSTIDISNLFRLFQFFLVTVTRFCPQNICWTQHSGLW